ncbi:MAG: hypothetical protein ACREJO_01255 [Phycisphaerales bacterium]
MFRSFPRMVTLSLALAASLCWTAGCQTTTSVAESHPQLFDGMGPHKRAVTTNSTEAQRYFDQGLTWTFAFNHDEAIRSFTEAARLDPDCAMAWWGIALCNGPHINNPAMDEAHSKAAWAALQRAEALAPKASHVEQALIAALSRRYANPAAGALPMTPEQRAPLDKAYAQAMARVANAYPADQDVAVLYAESLMDLRPWDLWAHDGTPRPETPQILEAIERVLAANPNHPGACHLYIHAVEASPHPERADRAAAKLRTLVPASGHLVHMPSHIDVRTGRWAMASDQNAQAIEVDAAYRKLSPTQGFYRIYMAHNRHFLAYACMMEGRSADSLAAARGMIASIPTEFIQQNAAMIDGYLPIPTEVLVRFGRWQEILEEPQPPQHLPITTTFWRFARATAYAALGDIPAAEREQKLFRADVRRVPEGALMAINPAHKVLSIADHTLEGEIAFRRGETDRAVSEFKSAIAIEDTLQYMEPPDWVQPVRHSLGAVLLHAGRVDEAEVVYREDLKMWPENGWSLLGLSKCLAAKNSPETAAADARLAKAWQRSDMKIGVSCLCVPVKGE